MAPGGRARGEVCEAGGVVRPAHGGREVAAETASCGADGAAKYAVSGLTMSVAVFL